MLNLLCNLATRWRGAIPKDKFLTRAEIGQLLGQRRGVLLIDVGVGEALDDLVVWASVALSPGCEEVLGPFTGKISGQTDVSRAVSAIGKQLSQRVGGIKGRIFRKSLEEALLEAAGVSYELDDFDLVGGLCKFRDRRGIKGFIELFLSFYVFNVVWIEIQDSARLTARDTRSFVASMKAVERVCFKLVRSELQRLEKKKEPGQFWKTPETGDEIMRALEDRLLELARQATIHAQEEKRN
jgi:hypothetical protein